MCRFRRCRRHGRPTPPPTPRGWPSADPEALRAAVVQLSTRVTALEWEKAALTFAAVSFGELAERLNAGAPRDPRSAARLVTHECPPQRSPRSPRTVECCTPAPRHADDGRSTVSGRTPP